MKKNYLLLSILVLASCNSNTVESSISESNVEEASSSSVDYSDYTDYEFTSVTELYLDVNETYNLTKMLKANVSCKMVSNNNYVEVNNGVLTGKDYGDSTITITYQKKKQDVTVHVVDYFEYGSYKTSTDLGRLYGKNVIFFGDSITHNWYKYTHDMELTGGESVIYPEYGWSGDLHKVCEFNQITNAACSGGTMGLPHDAAYSGVGNLLKSKCFPFCVERNIDAITSADYAFVFYGTNDLSAQIPIMTNSIADDKMTLQDSQASFVASMKYGIERMQEVNPDIKIFFMNILYRTYPIQATPAKYSMADYNKAIKDVATSYMCRTLDTNSIFDSKSYPAYIPEGDPGLHINDAGQQLVADFILNNGVK